MATKYNVVSNVDSSSNEDRAKAREVAAALSAMVGCGPAAEEAILPSRDPSAELAAKLTVPTSKADEMDAELREAVDEFTAAFGKGE